MFAMYPISDTEEQVRAAYEQRYGTQPERVELVIKSKNWKGRPWGWWEVGPVPDKKEVEYDLPTV
jgi:hypothetical protein